MASPKVFNFFGLPREIRDQIYSLLTLGSKQLSRRDKFRTSGSFQITIRNTTLPNLLLVNREFKAEYEDNVVPNQTVGFLEMGQNLRYPKPTKYFQNFRKIKVLLRPVCSLYCGRMNGCMAVEDVKQHFRWMQIALGAVHELQVKLFLYFTDEHVDDVTVQHTRTVLDEARTLITLPNVNHVEIYPWSNSMIDQRLEGCKDYQTPLATWTATGGWKERKL